MIQSKNKQVIEVVHHRQDLVGCGKCDIRKISIVLPDWRHAYADFVCGHQQHLIRLAAYSKRFLIHTMKLVGPAGRLSGGRFAAQHMWIGILAATMADAVLMGLAYMLVHYEPDLLAVVTPGVMVVGNGSGFLFSGVLDYLRSALISINNISAWKWVNCIIYNRWN